MAFNLEEEVIDGYLVPAETKKVWAVEMDLAKQLLAVCEKYGLKIWATGGTLIGAVRHRGFIPWDDDMDFCMMREDYNKLVEIGPSEFKEPYFFQSFYTDSFWGGMIKIRRSDTAMIPSNWNLREYNMGIFIDVFVMDAVPKDKKQLYLMYKIIKRLRHILHNNSIVHTDSLPPLRKLKHRLVSIFFKFIKPSTIQKRIVRLLSANKIQENDYCALLDFYAQSQFDPKRIKLRNKHYYDDTVMLPFHDTFLPAPKEYHKLLTDLFGDYLKPVRGGAVHTNILIDTERSYKEVLSELKKK